MAPKFAENRQNYLYFSNDGIDTETKRIIKKVIGFLDFFPIKIEQFF